MRNKCFCFLIFCKTAISSMGFLTHFVIIIPQPLGKLCKPRAFNRDFTMIRYKVKKKKRHFLAGRLAAILSFHDLSHEPHAPKHFLNNYNYGTSSLFLETNKSSKSKIRYIIFIYNNNFHRYELTKLFSCNFDQ